MSYFSGLSSRFSRPSPMTIFRFGMFMSKYFFPTSTILGSSSYPSMGVFPYTAVIWRAAVPAASPTIAIRSDLACSCRNIFFPLPLFWDRVHIHRWEYFHTLRSFGGQRSRRQAPRSRSDRIWHVHVEIFFSHFHYFGIEFISIDGSISIHCGHLAGSGPGGKPHDRDQIGFGMFMSKYFFPTSTILGSSSYPSMGVFPYTAVIWRAAVPAASPTIAI